MGVPSTLVYTQENTKYLQIGPITDVLSGEAVVGATVSATLYVGNISGSPVSGATDIPLVDQGGGIYRGTLGGESFTPAVGGNYVTAIDLAALDGSTAHWELPSVVTVRTS